MNLNPKEPPRTFKVGVNNDIVVSDCGEINLKNEEQVTFTTEEGHEHDFLKKEWGYYVAPSLNSRLVKFNQRPVLIKNIETHHFFILTVFKGKEDLFEKYLKEEKLEIITWLDSQASLEKIEALKR